MGSDDLSLRISQRGNAQPHEIAGGDVSPPSGTDANTARTGKNGETPASAPNASQVAGVEGLAQVANSSTISTGMPEGAGNKDRIDGKGEIQGSPAPVPAIKPCWTCGHYLPHNSDRTFARCNAVVALGINNWAYVTSERQYGRECGPEGKLWTPAPPVRRSIWSRLFRRPEPKP